MEKYLLLILGAIIGFIASIAKDYFVKKTKKKYKDIDFKREKLEELFILASRIFNESIKPIALRNNIEDKDAGAKAGLISRFYFPSIHKNYQEYLNVYIIINQKMMNDYNSVSIDELSNFTKEYQKFLNILELESKKYCWDLRFSADSRRNFNFKAECTTSTWAFKIEGQRRSCAED